ncbi:hypothetical protein AB4305_22585 [Nocardia sp. 2YAB30]|uniref:hypothetical protein n=1 Tax=unclassified Nocardia TaxID=2637762 RepID=UPI003F9C3EDA
MAVNRRRRVLTVVTSRYLWKTYHQHLHGCEEVLRLRRLGSVAGLTLVFEPGDRRMIPDGGTSAAGVVRLGDRRLNLNEPGVVRAFVDAAVDAGWMAEARTIGRRDGWDLFDDAYAKCATSADRDGR